MKYLIIYTHPNPKSFNHAIKEEIEANLKRSNKEYIVRDLYSLNFNPALAGNDFVLLKQGKAAEDVAREQDYVRNADCLIFVHPIWWYGMPAVLKGYLDRVFSYGFAYKYEGGGIKGLLKGKKVMIFNTTGGAADHYANAGYNDALKKTMDEGTYEFCGLEVIKHKFFYAVPSITQEERTKMLAEIKSLKF